ncbi:MAG: hypothetical protein WKI46_08020 [Aquificaceae bacterium]
MEIRRIEGILLQQAIEQSKPSQAQKAGEEFRIKVLSSVPDVFLELSSGGSSTIKAEVSSSEGNLLTLLLKDGFELKAENRSSLRFFPGDILELKIEEGIPLTFRITGLYRKGYEGNILNLVLEGEEKFYISINPEKFMEDLDNSGIFYERKLVELLLGKLKPEELIKDKKAQLVQSMLVYAEELSSLLNMEYEQSVDGIKKLLEALKLKVEEFNRVSSSLKTLLFENLDHEEYIKLAKFFESMGEVNLLKAMETKDTLNFLRSFWNLTEKGVLSEYREVFEKLKDSEEPVVRDFFRLVIESSEKDARNVYKSFQEYIERGRSLLEFYNSKGERMESFLSRLEFIEHLQWLLAKQGGAFYIPIYYQGGKGGLMFKSGQDYSAVFRLDYGDSFIAGLLKMPRSKELLDVLLFTDTESMAEKIRAGKELLQRMLLEEKIKLRSFSVSVSTKEGVADIIRSNYGEGFFLLV